MAQKYTKKDQISHILDRPDMYTGSVRNKKLSEFVTSDVDGDTMIMQESVSFSPAILRIFVEALSNALDNIERSKQESLKCTKIYVDINKETGETSVYNDGAVVPIELHEAEQCYIHSMIFGQLLTGSNYNDEEERTVSGRNGLGIKLCNVFALKFSVEGVDPKNGKHFYQEWTNNMRDTSGPVVKSSKLKKGFTKVTWTPDFKRFGLKSYTDDIVRLYTRYVIDAAMLSKVDVRLNESQIAIKSIADYAKFYTGDDLPEKLHIKTSSCEVLLTPSNGEFQAISFVNGVYTRLGGQHVDSWIEAFLRPLVDKYNGKDKKTKTTNPKININDVKQFFRVFVVATVVRPEFDGQDKNRLESPEVVAEVKKTHITAISKWSVIENIEDIIRSKEMVALKKVEKTTVKTKIEGYDRANKSGTKDSHLCSLFVTEGLSAKTYVVAGIKEGLYGKAGRDWSGILPVRGKLLNVRDKAATTIAGNKVICSLIQALGLKQGVDYTDDSNFKKLNYGRLVVVADADVDGIHIEGLIINMIHTIYPSLIERKTPFIISLKTPIARVKKGKVGDILFYDEINFVDWLTKQTQKVNIKYYKGLGTTKAEDVPDTFGKKLVEFSNDTNATMNMEKAFHKKRADDRKEWLGEYVPHVSEQSLDNVGAISTLEISDFINNELIKFSRADCARSIPHGVDGLKESQRKILYAVKKRNLKYSGNSLKVAQLAGYTAEHSNYHHGEKNLYDTCIGMAQDFPGSNNIPILYRDGMFGTRLEGGQDAADGRYIFTKMDALTELIYRAEDEPLLTYVNDDGDFVQPEFYVPIIPMMLVNGCVAGIGTGWSSNVPCFNPKDLVNAIKTWIENEGEVFITNPDNDETVSLFDEITPWYRGFHGLITKETDTKFVTHGSVVTGDKVGTYEVNELPIGMWTSNFLDTCEDLKVNKHLKEVHNYSTPKEVKFILKPNKDSKITCDIKGLKLTSNLHLSNLVMFNHEGKITKFESVDELLNEFCKVRYDFYVKRKVYQLNELENELRFLGNKERFILAVISGDIDIMNIPEDDIIEKLISDKYDQNPKCADGEGGYDYLLRLPIRFLTAEKVRQIRNDIESKEQIIENIKQIDESTMWLNDLEQFESEYDKWVVADTTKPKEVPSKTKKKK